MLFILKMTFNDIAVRPKSFFMSIVLLFVGEVFILTSMYEFYFAEYRINSVSRLVTDKGILHIRIIPDMLDENIYHNFEEFDKEMQNEYGNDYGKYMYLEACSFTGSGSKYVANTLFIDRNCFELCTIGSYFNESELAFDIGNIFIGSDLAKKLPPEYSVVNDVTGTEMKVIGVLPENSEWLSSNPFDLDQPSINLDECAVSLMDYDMFRWDYGVLYGACFQSIFLKVNSSNLNEIRRNVKSLSQAYGLMIQDIWTIQEEIENEYLEREGWIKAGGDLTIFAVFMTFAACISTCLSSALELKRESGIMRLCGISKIHILGINLYKNMISGFVSGMLSYSLYLHINNGGDNIVNKLYVLPAHIFLVTALIFTVSFSATYLLTRESEIKTINEVYT